MRALVVALGVIVGGAGVAAQTVSEPFSAAYTIIDLGGITDLPVPYGGITFKYNDPQKLVIAGASNANEGAVYIVGVTRDALTQHINGFAGAPTVIAVAGFVDAGVAYAPGSPAGFLFTTIYGINHIYEFAPGSTAKAENYDLTTRGVARSVGGLAFVPDGYPGARTMKLTSLDSARWYSFTEATEGVFGTLELGAKQLEIQLADTGPEGIAYVPVNSAGFEDKKAMLIGEYLANRVSAYETDSNGDPLTATRRDFITGLTRVIGMAVDPVTKDILICAPTNGQRLHRVEGFGVGGSLPSPTASEMATESPSPTESATATATATPSASPSESPSPTPDASCGRSGGDFDGTCCADLQDFLFLLDNWQLEVDGQVVGLDDFLNLLDYWQVGSACP